MHANAVFFFCFFVVAAYSLCIVAPSCHRVWLLSEALARQKLLWTFGENNSEDVLNKGAVRVYFIYLTVWSWLDKDFSFALARPSCTWRGRYTWRGGGGAV